MSEEWAILLNAPLSLSIITQRLLRNVSMCVWREDERGPVAQLRIELIERSRSSWRRTSDLSFVESCK